MCAAFLPKTCEKPVKVCWLSSTRAEILDANDLRRLAAHALDDDVLELFGVGKPAQRIDGELEDLVVRNRRAAELSRNHLDVLLLDRLLHVERGEAVGLQLVGVEPDPHAVLAGAAHRDLADAGQAASGYCMLMIA